MPWHFSRKSGCYHYGHSYPMQKSGTAVREGLGGIQPPPPLPHFLDGLENICYFILLNSPYPLLTETTVHYILFSILRFAPTNPTISDNLPLGLLLNGRVHFNREKMEFQLSFLKSTSDNSNLQPRLKKV